MTTDTPRISFLPTATPDRIFRRVQEDVGGAMPMDDAINRVATAIASDVPCDDILNEIAVAASLALGSDIGLVRALSDDDSNFVIVAASGPAPLSIGGLIGSYSVIADDVRDCSPGDALIVDLRAEAQSPRLPSNERWEFEHIGGRHLLIVPLWVGGALVGRLDLIRIADYPFTQNMGALALPFATFAATALRDRQFRQSNEERQVFQTVIRLHESVEQLADPETILQAVVELIVRDPGCDRCYALLWNNDRSEFVPTAVAGLEAHLVDILKLISLSPQVVPAFDQMVHSSRPLVIADATRSTLLPASLVRALNIRAAMIVPLRSRRQQTSGVLLLDYSREGVVFSDTQVSMMAQMAQHLSTLIENAILFEEIRSSSDSVSIINEIAIQLAMLTDEESIFRQLYYQVASVLDASRFGMALLTSDRRGLEVRSAIDGDVQSDSHIMALGDDPLSVVAASGRSELAGTRTGSDAREWLPGYASLEQAHSQLTVPVTVGRNVIGALSIQSTFRNAYGPRDKELLTAVALHTGIAIENARLYRLVQSRGDRRAAVLDQVMAQQEIERKELVDDIHDDTLQTLAACLYRLDQARAAVEKLNQEDPALAQISGVRESLSDNIARLRQRIFSIRPATLDRLGLESALRELLGQIRRESELLAEFEVDLPSRLVPEAESLAYRLIQEAITHIRGLEHVTTVTIRVTWAAGNVVISIEDDRRHAPDAPLELTASRDVALMALVERADLAGGRVRMSRRAAGGSLIQIALPAELRQAPVAFFSHPPVSIQREQSHLLSDDHDKEGDRGAGD